MSDQEIRQRRKALANAVNSHDLKAVLSFIDTSFVAKNKQGVSVGFKDMVAMVEQLFAAGTNYQETVEIEQIEVSSDDAKLVVRRTERGRSPGSQQIGLMYGLTIMCLFMGILNLNRGEWDFQKISTVVVLAVLTFGFFFFALYLQRTRERTVRYQETWRLIDGCWLLVAEQEI